MDEYHMRLLIDLHKNANRQGPGSDQETRFAIALSGLAQQRNLKIVDIGCGTGASACVLAEQLDAQITAVDFIQDFLDVLDCKARAKGIHGRLKTLQASMEALPFPDEGLDAIWSEGAIYNMGFERGVSEWRRFLKPGGVLAVSEITWLTDERPQRVQTHWLKEYPEIDTASAKIKILEQNGFTILGYFPLPGRCWVENYYAPLEGRFADFLRVHNNSLEAEAIVKAERDEIALYKAYNAYFGYGYYIAKKLTD